MKDSMINDIAAMLETLPVSAVRKVLTVVSTLVEIEAERHS